MDSPYENIFTSILLSLAKKYDSNQELLLDRHMCTLRCPCFSQETWKDDRHGHKLYRIDPYDQYMRIHEEVLNFHKRTKMDNPKYEPLVFTDDPEEGVSSFT